MKKRIASLSLAGALTACTVLHAAEPVKLPAPNLDRGKPVMRALAERRSTRQFDARELSRADLSDLLWAATGVNRPESGRRTNPTAINRQEIDVYLCTAEGNYLYDFKNHALVHISDGDARPLAAAPVNLVIVGRDDFNHSDVDAGIVSQNISIFCAGVDLATVPRAQMDREALKKALALDAHQIPILNHPVGHFVR